MNKILPRYPIYVISKGRYENCLTAKFLIKDKVPFHLVVEPQECNEYIKRFGAERVYKLPFSNLGQGSIPVRNWVWEHAKKVGYKRHWILDDNIRGVLRRYKTKRILINSGIAFKITEDFIERYENIAIAGLNYHMFMPDSEKHPPFCLNVHVYSCLLILNKISYKWRGRYNEDTDLCLQVLSGGWCTVLMNIFLIKKMTTMLMKGGNTDILYQDDGRLKMARSLERMWPGVVKTKRKFRRPQHIIDNNWHKFDTLLIKKKGLKIDNKINEYGMKLVKKKKIKSKLIKKLYRQYKIQ